MAAASSAHPTSTGRAWTTSLPAGSPARHTTSTSRRRNDQAAGRRRARLSPARAEARPSLDHALTWLDVPQRLTAPSWLYGATHRPHVPRASRSPRRDREASTLGDRHLLHDHDARRGALACGTGPGQSADSRRRTISLG